jgi:SAM-dependent methyltransferase
VCELDPERASDYAQWAQKFDSALCVNLLESVEDPEAVIASLTGCLKPGGSLVVLVPQGKTLFSALDQGMGHRRRFEEGDLRSLLESHGFQIEHEHQINKIGALSWWFFGKILHRPRMNRPGLKLWDKTVWFWRRVDPLLPWRGLSLIIVARLKGQARPEAN